MTVLDPAATGPAVTDQPLSVAVRTGSAAEHESAEGSSFMSELLAGRLSSAGYAAYLLRLREVYAALEDAVRSRLDDPAVAAVHDPALERLAAIDADLEHWAPEGPGAPRGTGSVAAGAYVARLREASAWGGLLVAHHYTRYLGDLSGGQAIGRVLSRSYELDGGRGVAFYDFPLVPKPKPYKDAYRARLDALPMDAADKARVVAEVQVAFRLNRALFEELGRDLEAYRR